jgi:hypothetical protein
LRRSVLLAMVLASIAVPSSRAGDRLSLKDVVRRVGAYVDAYGERASVVVATERYTQTLTEQARGEVGRRSIVADFAIVKAEANHTWIGFRDVIEVDGRRVTDHDDRLIQVLTGSAGSIDEALRINDESARFNIGPIERNFNVPTTVLFYFKPDNLDRFKFTVESRDADGAWQIAFRETSKPTLIRTTEGTSVRSEGSLRVNPVNGTILQTRLRLKDVVFEQIARQGSVEIGVTYRHVEPLSMWLPDTMTESYLVLPRSGSWSRVTARAEYSNYRRFQTSVRIK